MSEMERRSAKLHKQPEVEDDEDDDGIQADESDENITSVPNNTTTTTAPTGVCTPTVVSASSSEASPEDISPKIVPPPITRKQTLIRTQALEGTSPPPDSFFSPLRSNGHEGCLSNGSSSPGRQRGSSHEAKEFMLSAHGVSNDSGRGTLDINDAASDTQSLSRTSSMETSQSPNLYQDSSGVDLPHFFKQTLQKSVKDRKTLIWLEKELHAFIRDETVQTRKMHEMNPYDRMLLHRMAAYMGIEHNVDQSGKSIIIAKTDITRIPELTLSECLPDLDNDTQVKKKILLKKPQSLDEKQRGSGGKAHLGSIRAKSLEERQQNYAEARQRIFKKEGANGDGSQSQNYLSAPHMPGIVQQRSLDSLRPNLSASKTSMTFSCLDPAAMQHGTESRIRQRSTMTKSNSYGGSVSHHGVQSPHGTTHSMDTRCADSPYRNSPVDHTVHIGYGGDHHPSHIQQQQQQQSCPTSYAYLVSTDYTSIPEGSVIINPHTMQPHVNPDGSEYRFDPANPPPFMTTSTPPPPQPVPTPPSTSIVYPVEAPMSDLSVQLSKTSLNPLDPNINPLLGQVESYSVGQPMVPQLVPTVMTQLYAASPQHFTQGQYVPSSGPAVRFVALSPQAVESGPTTVPMPAVQHPYSNHVQYHHVALTGAPQEVTEVTAYPQIIGQDSAGLTASQQTGANPAHLIQGLSYQYPTAVSQYSAVNQYSPMVGSSTMPNTYYSGTPTPPSLTQPPPAPNTQSSAAVQASHTAGQAPQMYSVLSTVASSVPQSSSPGKSWGGLLQPSSPPQQTQAMTINYLTGPHLTQPPTQPAQVLAIPSGSFPQRPQTVIQLTGPPHTQQGLMQPYVYRPFAPVPGGMRPRVPSLQLNAPHSSQPARPK